MPEWSATVRYRFLNQLAWEVVLDTIPYDPHTMAFDVIGNVEGSLGWHVNARWIGTAPLLMQASVITPTLPLRIFAGERSSL